MTKELNKKQLKSKKWQKAFKTVQHQVNHDIL